MGAIVTISASVVAHRGHCAGSSRVCCGSRGMRGSWNEALILTTTSIRLGSTPAFATAWRPWNGNFHEIEERWVALGFWQKILSLFSSKAAVPSDAPRLRAETQSELAASLALLPDRETGWITLAEARRLFSHMDEQYAFGEMDEQGQSSLGKFAAQPDHRS